MKKGQVLRALVAAVVVLISGGPMLAQAATTSSGTAEGNGYRIYPIRSDLKLNPGSSTTVSVYLQNISSKTENLQVVINDFQARSDETGAPSLLLNNKYDYQHGLKQFITTPVTSITVAPNEQTTITAVINLPKNATGGGYYGAIRVLPASSVGDKQVNLAASVASLILVTVPGNAIEHLSIASFEVTNSGGDARSFYGSGKGLSATVRLQNSGNVQVVPFGKIQLKKGKTILATYDINNTSIPGNVLPNSIRKFSVGLKTVNGFGKYTVVGNFGYGSAGQLLSAQKTFYIVPGYFLILFVILLVLILGLVLVVLRRRSHNHRGPGGPLYRY